MGRGSWEINCSSSLFLSRYSSGLTPQFHSSFPYFRFMNPLDHCKLCDKHDVNIQTGIFCTLTGQKPNFQGRCKDAKFDVVARHKLEESSGTVYLLRAQKLDRQIMVFGQILFGTIILAGGLFLNKMYWDGGWISYTLLTVPATGFGLISGGLRYQVKSAWWIKNSDEQLQKELLILEQYGIAASASHETRKVHGEWEIKSSVTLHSS